MTDNSTKDGSGDAILGSEVDANPNSLAKILDGTTAVALGGDGTVVCGSLKILDVGAAATNVATNFIVGWDPASGTMTDNSSGVGIDFQMPDDAANQTVFASLDVMCLDDAASSEDGEFSFKTVVNASEAEVLTLSGAGAAFSVDAYVGDGKALVVGHTAQMTAGGVVPEVQVLGTAAADSQMVLGRFSADSSGPVLTFAKSRDPAIFDGSFAIVADDDQIGAIYATSVSYTHLTLPTILRV
jgi:hypothetical protein